MQIRDILGMKGGTIFSIEPEGRLAAAVDLMVSNDIGSLVVMRDGEMAGMLTFREVLQELKARAGNLGDARAGDAQRRDRAGRDPRTGDPRRGEGTGRGRRAHPQRRRAMQRGSVPQ